MEGTEEVGREEYQEPEGYSDEDYFEDEQFLEGDEHSDEGIPDLTGSEPKPLGGIYQLFDTVRRTPDSTKVSNLNEIELGDLGISVRECMRIALLADTFGHKGFANFFRKQAGIISDSSMSKKGWFTELFVTSKRYASRESASKVDELPHFNKGKWKMFSKGSKSQNM